MRASILSSGCSGRTRRAFPTSGWSTRSIRCTGSPGCRIRAAWWRTAAFICGRMGAQNWDTMTAVFDYGPLDDLTKGFQVQYTSRFTNSAGGVKELYYSNGGMIDMDKQTVTPEGGLTAKSAAEMKHAAEPAAELLAGGAGGEGIDRADTGGDPQTSANMRNWMECVRSRKTPNAPHRSGLQPFDRAVHERCGDPDRAEGHVRRQDAAGDGGRQGLCVDGRAGLVARGDCASEGCAACARYAARACRWLPTRRTPRRYHDRRQAIYFVYLADVAEEAGALSADSPMTASR